MNDNEHGSETYRSMISISVELMKALLLLNGGAVIAMLSFLGSSSSGAKLAKYSAAPLASFVLGLVFTVCTFTFAYATQFALFNETLRPGKYSGPKHMTCMRIALVFLALGLAAFAVGCISSVRLLAGHGD